MDTSGGWTKYSETYSSNYINSTSTCIVVSLYIGPNSAVTQVQLEPGPVPTPYEQRPIGTELALCQRYFQKLFLAGAVVCMGNDADRTARTPQLLPVKMRATPTVEKLVKDDSAVAVTQSGTTRTKSAPSAVSSRSDDLIEINNVSTVNNLETIRYYGATVELDAEL